MLSRNLWRCVSKRHASTAGLTPVAAPKYPPILDLSERSVKIRERETYADKYNSLDTVEEKLFYKNLQHYYGTRCFLLKEGEFPVDLLPFAKYTTRTRTVEADEKLFHQLLNFNANEAKELVDRIRPYLQEALLFELLGRHRPDDVSSGQKTAALVERINDILLSSLSMQYPHLLDASVDYSPRVEAFWLAGNFHPSPDLYKEREKKKEALEKENKLRYMVPLEIKVDLEETVEHHIQYVSRPLVALRSKLPLSQLDTALVSGSDSELEKFLADDFPCPTLSHGLEEIRRFGTNLPGYWPGDPCEFGLLSYHHLNELNVSKVILEQEKKSRLVSQALLNGFSWLHAQASILGFSTFSELTYPLTSQQVMTDGRNFSFSLYQLNTTIMHKLLASPNNRTNLCVTLGAQPLYQDIKANNFVGWNDSVLLNLLAFYLNEPKARDGVDMKPYINPAVPFLSQIEDEDRRQWLHKQFRHMYSNRPRHRLGYEIYDWERIYKIEFETRSQDARMRPFERDQNPTEERKYWDHMPPYVPKKDRENPKKMHWRGWRAKFAKTYYPEP